MVRSENQISFPLPLSDLFPHLSPCCLLPTRGLVPVAAITHFHFLPFEGAQAGAGLCTLFCFFSL